MNIYIAEDYINHNDFILINKLVNCYYNLYHTDVDELKENSLFITIPGDWLFQPSDEWKSKMKSIKNKSLLLVHHGKSLSMCGPDSLVETTKKELIDRYNFSHDKVFLITQLKYDIQNIKKYLPNINILSYDRWLFEFFSMDVETYHFRPKKWFNIENTIPYKKFSIFCKRYSVDRLNFFCHLLTNNLLDNFNYTFVGDIPIHYTGDCISKITKDISPEFEPNKELISNWIKGIPYKEETKLDHAIFQHSHYPYGLRHYLESSGIHVVLETEPMDTSFITEKTYRAMYHKKPFILISQHNALEALKAEGYKTFSPYVDESYDKLEKYEDRVQAVIKELIRLNNLSQNEYDNLLINVKEIVEHNFKIIHENVYQSIPEEFKIKRMLEF